MYIKDGYHYFDATHWFWALHFQVFWLDCITFLEQTEIAIFE